MRSELLVTGCYRSGTTLLEKLLHAHPGACVASQPFPALFTCAKEIFDAGRGLHRRYPLSHRFLEDEYSDADLATFLDDHELSDDDLDTVFRRLAGHTEGHWTPEILGRRSTVKPGRFVEVYRQLMRAVTALIGRSEAQVVGSKEILVEEFVPYLLARGVRAVIIIRDPRDMIASLNFGERDSQTGGDRPVLYSVRVWRKSVATALAMEGHPGFRWVRYEDLVADPSGVLAELALFLGLPAFPADVLQGPVRDQQGRSWRGNSSFRDQSGISSASVGRFDDLLSPYVRTMIETAAGPEMELLGYAKALHDPAALTGYRDPFTRMHAAFPADYSCESARVRNEIERLQRLQAPDAMTDRDARRWFIYPEAYRRLRANGRHC